MRRSGILLPISSLPSKYGIGSFSKEAFHFVDFLAESKQKIWQIIPFQDYLEIGKEGRINKPSTLGDNWTWRLTGRECTKELSERISELVRLYQR